MNTETHCEDPADLQQLLCRPDVWRGSSHCSVSQPALSTGHPPLDQVLQNGGWPKHSLVEVCQDRCHLEWQLLAPILQREDIQYTVLVNPPTRPFAPALRQLGVDLDRLVVVEAPGKSDFLRSFIELSRASAVGLVVGWQPRQSLSYTELRKCQLACIDGPGMYCLFRPATVLEQSSPASLRIRLDIQESDLRVTVIKQRGALRGKADPPVTLPLPRAWLGGFAFHALQQKAPGRRKPTPIPIREPQHRQGSPLGG